VRRLINKPEKTDSTDVVLAFLGEKTKRGGGGAKNRGEMGGNSLKLSNIETECQNETECPVFTLNCHTLHPGCGYQSPIIKDLQQEGDHLNMR
jgi:hypothetical protein